MAAITVEGPGAHDLLQNCLTKDLDACIGKSAAPIGAGRCVYGAFLTPDGGVIDDSIVYKRSGGHYLVVVNAGEWARRSAPI